MDQYAVPVTVITKYTVFPAAFETVMANLFTVAEVNTPVVATTKQPAPIVFTEYSSAALQQSLLALAYGHVFGSQWIQPFTVVPTVGFAVETGIEGQDVIGAPGTGLLGPHKPTR